MPQSVWSAVVFWADLLADSWSLLTDCIRTGKPASQVRDPKIPSRWSQEPEADSIFRAVMGTAPAQSTRLSRKRGIFPALRSSPTSAAVVGRSFLLCFRLTGICGACWWTSNPAWTWPRPRFAAEDPSSRCELIAADLAQSVPTGADVYLLKHVLHGRQDRDAITILKNCRAAIPQNGSLLIVEFILPPLVSHADPQLEGHLMSDLNMLAVTGGKERSEREWKMLLEAAGFILTRVLPVGGDNLMVRNVGILEAKPV